MKKLSKSFFGVLLCLVMLFSLLPAVAPEAAAAPKLGFETQPEKYN